MWLELAGLRDHAGCKRSEEQQGVRTEVPLGLRLEGCVEPKAQVLATGVYLKGSPGFALPGLKKKRLGRSQEASALRTDRAAQV